MYTPNLKPYNWHKKIDGYEVNLRIWNYELRSLPLSVFLLITSLLLFCCSNSFAQTKQIDSLSKLIFIEKIDTNRIKLTNELAWAYFQAKNSTKAKILVFQNIKTTQKLNWQKGLAYSYETLGDFYYNSKQLDSSIFYCLSATNIYKQLNDSPAQICYMLCNLGSRYNEQSQFAESKKCLVEAYDLAVKTNNEKYQFEALSRTGWLYHGMGNHLKSLDYFSKAEALAIKTKDEQKQIDLISGFANDYIALGRYKEAQEKQFLAVNYYKKKNDWLTYAFYLSSAANLYRRLNQNAKAEKPLLEVYEIQKKYDDKFNLLTTARYLGMLYTEQQKFDLAKRYLDETLMLSRAFNNSSDITKAYYTLERFYYAKNDFTEGDRYQKLIIRRRDSLYTAEQNKALAEFDVKYKTAEKERQFAKSQLEIAQKRNWIIGLSTLLVSLVVLSLAYWKNRETKQKAIFQAIEIEKQREILKVRELERQRIAKELHDSVGSQLTVVSTSLDNAYFLAENHRLVPERIENINSEVRLAAQSLRDTIWATHNTTISVTQLYARIQHYLSKISENSPSLVVNSERIGTDVELNSIQALNIFRIFQEAVQNIQKHAEASEVKISIFSDSQVFKMKITDNGKGFSIGKITINENFGLSNMQNRSDEIVALLTIQSEENAGTTITLDLPL